MRCIFEYLQEYYKTMYEIVEFYKLKFNKFYFIMID